MTTNKPGLLCKFRRVFPAAILLVACQFAGTRPAIAAGPEIKVSGPKTLTSSCVGDVSSLDCAVDTWIACMQRRAAKLCGLVGIPDVKFKPKYRPATKQYIIFDFISRSPHNSSPNSRDQSVLPVEHWEVRVLVRECQSETAPHGCTGKFSKAAYYLGSVGANWRLLGWTHEADATCGYHDLDGERFDGDCKLFVERRPGFYPWH